MKVFNFLDLFWNFLNVKYVLKNILEIYIFNIFFILEF